MENFEITDSERFGAMGWQSMANLILNESRDSHDRLKAWEILNANALDIGNYWSGLSHWARSRILGAMALDISDLGFLPVMAESESHNRLEKSTQQSIRDWENMSLTERRQSESSF